MNKKNILITGGCGYIGLHLCKLMKNHNLIIYDNLKYSSSIMNKFGKVYRGELSDIDKLTYLFNKYRFNCVIHLAELAHISESVYYPQLYYNNNLIQSINLLNFVVKHNIKYFIFSSSCAVYGNHMLKESSTQTINEFCYLKPISPYGNSKMMFEYILQDYSNKYKFNYAILRYFNVCGSDPEFEIGEYPNEKRLIPKLIKCSLGIIGEVHIFGNDYDTKDGTTIKDYTHVCDIAYSHIKALKYITKNNKNITCNIGSGKGYSIKEIITIIEHISKKKLNIKIKKRRQGDSPFIVCSNKFAKETIDWEPKYDIHDILNTSYQWYSVHLPLIKNKLHLQTYYAINENRNGDVYTGYIKNNQYNGEGKLVFSNGCVCEGLFENDELVKSNYIMNCFSNLLAYFY